MVFFRFLFVVLSFESKDIGWPRRLCWASATAFLSTFGLWESRQLSWPTRVLPSLSNLYRLFFFGGLSFFLLFSFLPQQALFLIGKPEQVPNVASPQLFSQPFLDFVSGCCTYNASKRPTAKQLSSHSFIECGKAKRDLLASHLKDILVKVRKKKGRRS